MNAKQLRNSILQMAIQGKLVPQDPNDEPASVLLDKIRQEKKRLVKEGKLKKKDIIEVPISDDEKPFEIPDSWEWCRLNGITELIEDCPHSTAPNEGAGYPLIRTPNVGFGKLLLDGVHRVSEDVYNKRNERAIPQANDLIYAREATAGNIAVIRNGQKVCLGQRTVLVRPMKNQVNSNWLAYFILSPYSYRTLVGESTGTTVAHVNLSDFRPFILPLPPLAEQHRIVAKLEEILPLVDEYGKAQEEADKLQAELPDKLRKSILQEAIQGKLVPQDPNDEPASILLDKIRQEKKRLVKEGVLKKKDFVETPISDDEKPFDIPKSWDWVRFGTITYNRDSERIPLSVVERSKLKKKYDYYGASGVIDKVDKYLFDKPLLLIGEDGANLINRSTPIAFIAKGKYWVNNHAHVLDFLNEDLMQYMCWYINAISLVEYVTGTAQPKMNQVKMNSILVALPPLAEQQRIVAKIEELFNQLKITN